MTTVGGSPRAARAPSSEPPEVVSSSPQTIPRGTRISSSSAQTWTVTDGGKVYTFKLRQGVKWSDGQDFNADDVMFTLVDVASNTGLKANQSAVFKVGGGLRGGELRRDGGVPREDLDGPDQPGRLPQRGQNVHGGQHAGIGVPEFLEVVVR